MKTDEGLYVRYSHNDWLRVTESKEKEAIYDTVLERQLEQAFRSYVSNLWISEETL
jgi:hypothetical protein